MSTCKIHNVRFYNLEPRAVTCLCHEPRNKKLALSRNDNSIEIWNIANAPFLERTIVGAVEGSVETVLWVGERLFSTGLLGTVVEYDLRTLSFRYEVAVTGGAAWCMDVNRSQTTIAVGTEDGYINTFNVTSDSLIYEKIFDKQEGRILCIRWDNTGEVIFTGSVDTVRVWNARSGLAVHRMTTSRKEAHKETIVWCLAVTEDNTIVSGDSRGVLSFWDPVMGTLIESLQSHTADVLAVAMSNDAQVVYCAGVHPVVCSFSRIILKSSTRPQWVRGTERRLHDHDVRALVEAEGKLYSAGVDGYLAQSTYPPKVLVKYPPLLQSPCVTVCKKSRCVLLRYANFLELWRLGSPCKSPQTTVPVGSTHQLDDEPIKLLQLKTRNDESIVSCAVSRDSKMIVYSTDTHVRVFDFNVINGDAQLSRNYAELPVKRVQKILFSPNSKRLVLVDPGKSADEGQKLVFTKVEKTLLRFEGTVRIGKELQDNVSLMCFSPDSKYLVCADHQSRIAVYKVDEDVGSGNVTSWALPQYRCPPTAMAIQKISLDLVIVYSDHKIVEYNIPRRQYTPFSNDLQAHLPKQWLCRPFPITNVTFDPGNENVIIMHDDTTIYVIDRNKELPRSDAKIPKLENGDSMEGSNSVPAGQSQHAFHVVKKYKHLVHLDWLVNDEMVAVEVNPNSLTEKLPPILKQKWFGM